jgi:hypothetical protein
MERDMDIRIQNEGSLWILYGATTKGRRWLKTHLPPDVQRWATGFVCEPRYGMPICEYAAQDGLTIGR